MPDLDINESRAAATDDLDFWAALCMPDIAILGFPPFYVQVWFMLIKNIHELTIGQVFRFALGLPRGHVKTTFLKLLVVYCIIHDLADFILIVCATEPRAEDFLDDVHDILLSDNITKLYGNWAGSLERDTKAIKVARYRGKKYILAAVGAQTSLRGINIKNRRPNLILLDDAQTDKNDESPTEREKLLKWITGTLLKARSPIKCAVLYIGNMYSNECILFKFKQSSSWTSLITGAILADGKALWQEIWSMDALIDDYTHDASVGQAATWFAEVQNDPQGGRRSLLADNNLPTPSEEVLESAILGSFITIDPAGNKKNSDDNVIAGHFIREDDVFDVNTVLAGNWNPEQVIVKTLTLAVETNASVIFIEAAGYQQTLNFWFEKYIEDWNLAESITIMPISPGNMKKLTRIRDWIKEVYAGSYILSTQQVRNYVLFQAINYKLERSDNKDDVLDCCAYGEFVRSNHRHLVDLSTEVNLRVNIPPVTKHNTPIKYNRRRSTHGAQYR